MPGHGGADGPGGLAGGGLARAAVRGGAASGDLRRGDRWEPCAWGPAGTQAGFGRYVYRYDSGHGGESHVVGFSPRKPEISFYGLTSAPGAAALLERLGKHRLGKSCLYVKRLAAVDEAVLRAMIRAGVEETKARWPVHPV